jgi:hypothetical protein
MLGKSGMDQTAFHIELIWTMMRFLTESEAESKKVIESTPRNSKNDSFKVILMEASNKWYSERYRADKVNDMVQGIFDQLLLNRDVGELYEAMVKVKQTEDQSTVAKIRSSAEAEIGKIDARLKSLQTLLMDGALDLKDYHEMRKQCEREKEDLKVLTMENTSDRLDAKRV